MAVKIQKITVGPGGGSEILPTEYRTRAEAEAAKPALRAESPRSSFIVVSGFAAKQEAHMPDTDNTTGAKVGEKFLVTSPGPYSGSGYYGKGDTVEEAKANLKAAGGSLVRYVVYLMPTGATGVAVTGFGDIEWTWAEGADRTGRPQVVGGRGKRT